MPHTDHKSKVKCWIQIVNKETWHKSQNSRLCWGCWGDQRRLPPPLYRSTYPPAWSRNPPSVIPASSLALALGSSLGPFNFFEEDSVSYIRVDAWLLVLRYTVVEWDWGCGCLTCRLLTNSHFQPHYWNMAVVTERLAPFLICQPRETSPLLTHTPAHQHRLKAACRLTCGLQVACRHFTYNGGSGQCLLLKRRWWSPRKHIKKPKIAKIHGKKITESYLEDPQIYEN